MKRGDSLTNNSGSSWSLLICNRQSTKGCRRRFTGLLFPLIPVTGATRAIARSPLPMCCRPRERAQSTVRLRLTRDKCFLTAYGRVKSGLKPAVKNRAAHGGEDCAARRVKTKANALGIGGQAPICRAVRRTESERNSKAPCQRGDST